MAAERIIDTRRAQMFPTLKTHEMERLRHLGEMRNYAAGERMVGMGEVSPGMFVLFAGEVDITQRDHRGQTALIVTHGPGSFLGELSQLSGRPSLVDAHAVAPVEALVIASDKLRDLMVEEADLGERIMRALILRRVGLLETGAGGPVIVGPAHSARALELVTFLARNGHPHEHLDPDKDSCGAALVERFQLSALDLPLVLCPNGETLRSPTPHELARCLGMVSAIDASRVYDVAIVGAGPAGLAAAVYAASEGLAVLVVDCHAFGGQAGASARIENYLGFPTGIRGMALMARAYNQAQKFGVEFAIPDQAVHLEEGAGGTYSLALENGERATARAVVIASGARYRRLEVDNLSEFEGTCVHYWASPLEARLCAGQEVALVGAGNSAGQAAVYLASQVRKVWLVVRGAGLEASMSRYLIDRIAAQPNIEVVTRTEVSALRGQDGVLEGVRWRDRSSGEESSCDIRHVFLFIGAEPNTHWLAGSGIALDAKGFVCTGADLERAGRPLETSRPGVFAIGDARAGSVKRVAAAVGEGAQVVAAIHAYLSDNHPPSPA